MSLAHPFYQKPLKEQQTQLFWSVAILVLSIVFLVVLALITSWYWIMMLIIPVIMVAAPFVDTPLGKKNGKLIYFSPMLITEKPGAHKIILHGGTLFDYFHVLDSKMSGAQRTRFIIQSYLEGLLCLMEAYPTPQNPPLVLEGTSYILQDNAAGKLGFEAVPTNGAQLLIMVLNYPTLIIAQSISRKKLSFPNLMKTKTFRTTLDQLKEKEDYIRQLHRLLGEKSAR